MELTKKDLIAALAAMDEENVDDILDEAEKIRNSNTLNMEDINNKRDKMLEAVVDYLSVNPIAEMLGFPFEKTKEEEIEALKKAILAAEAEIANAVLINIDDLLDINKTKSKPNSSNTLKNIIKDLI